MYTRLLFHALGLLFIGKTSAFYQNTISGHYNFTVIHEPPYMDVGVSDGIILSKDQWKGYIVDMIKIISQKAGFTYELFLPSGGGSGCGTGATNIELATKYLCGQQDTLDLNLTHGYWSQFYVTKGRLEDGTVFTTPFLSNVGLGLLVLPAEASTFESFSLLFTPFSWEMWMMTLGVCVFVSMIVWLTEIVEYPSKQADRTINALTSTVYRKTDLSQVEDFFVNEGGGNGLFDMNSYMRFPSFFLGTFSGLMNSSDDTKEGEERVTPSGPFASAWCFFVLFWASAYTANLAATLTQGNIRTNVESLDHLAQNGDSICAKLGAAYTTDLINTYPNLVVKTYPAVNEMVLALQAKECAAVVDSYAGLNGIANGVTDLDTGSERNYCNVKNKMILAGEPLPTGFTDMAVGISWKYPELRAVIDYWITAMRTCSPSDDSGDCPRSGLGGGVNLEILRQQHVEQGNCGDAHLSDAEPVVLGIENFFFPIMAVVVAGFIMLSYYSVKFLRRIFPYMLSDDFDLILSSPLFSGCFKDIEPGRRVLMLDNMFALIKQPDHSHFRAKLVKAAARHYLQSDLRSFYAIVRLGHILYPGTIDGFSVKGTNHLKTAGRIASEVEAGVDLLIVRAISSSFHHSGTLEDFTFVCRDEQQYARMDNAGWGEKALTNIEIGSEDDQGSENRYSSGQIRRPSVEMVMKDSITVPYA